MEKMIAACGLDCNACPARIASLTNDQDLRKKTAGEWSVAYGFDFKPEMINCHGCFATDGVQIGHCAQCGMRACAVAKGLANCAGCAEFNNCDKTRDFYVHCPEALANLQALRA
jgi:hypothetical protein